MVADLPGRTLIVIPAWNEEATISDVLAEVRSSIDADVLVVNDGSTDATVARARAAGALVLDLPLNLGVGGAMRAGYLFAARNGYDYAVQLDADGQHNPADVPTLIAALRDTGADVAIGARFDGTGDYEARGPRRWMMSFLAGVLSRVTKTRLTDATSGFKACDAKAIALFSRNYPAEYLGDTVEALVIAARSGLKVTQVGVAMRPRAGGTPSHSPWKAGLFLVRALLALFVALTRPTIARGE